MKWNLFRLIVSSYLSVGIVKRDQKTLSEWMEWPRDGYFFPSGRITVDLLSKLLNVVSYKTLFCIRPLYFNAQDFKKLSGHLIP